MNGGGPGQRPAADAIEELLIAQELEEVDRMDPAELAADLDRLGYDEARMTARIDAVVAASRGEPSAQRSPAIASIAVARQKKEAAHTRWGLLAAAAGVAAMLGGGGLKLAERAYPRPVATYPTFVPPPTSRQIAASGRRMAARLCEMGYYGECEDWLDAARLQDPSGEQDAAVQGLRRNIEQARLYGTVVLGNAKPGVSPGERPLQRTP